MANVEDKRTQIVRLLNERTQAGALAWEKMGDGNGVRVQLGPNTIVIQSQESRDQTVQDPDIVIKVFGPDAQLAEEFTDLDLFEATNQPWFPKMRDLFESANRAALGTDKVIDDVISLLGGGGA